MKTRTRSECRAARALAKAVGAHHIALLKKARYRSMADEWTRLESVRERAMAAEMGAAGVYLSEDDIEQITQAAEADALDYWRSRFGRC